MAAGKFDMKELERRMRGAIDTLKKEFQRPAHGPRQRASARSGRGQRLRRSACRSIRWRPSPTPDARTISVQVWDKSQVSAVEKAIREANLGLNPIIDGALIRLPIPALNAERRAGAGQGCAQICRARARGRAQRAARRHGAAQEARQGRQDERGRPSQELGQGAGADRQADQGDRPVARSPRKPRSSRYEHDSCRDRLPASRRILDRRRDRRAAAANAC